MSPIDPNPDPFFADEEYTPNDCPAGWIIPSVLIGLFLCCIVLAFARLMGV